MPTDVEILFRTIYFIGIIFVVLFLTHIVSSRVKSVPIRWSRIGSLLILYIVLLGVLALPPLGLTVFCSALIVFGVREGFRAAKSEVASYSTSFVKIYAVGTAAIIPYLLHFMLSIVATYLIIITIILFSIPLFAHDPPQTLKSVVRAFIAIAFSSLFSLIILLRAEPMGLAVCILLIFLTNGTDTTAYMIGKLQGRRRLIPQLSPEKTVEGTVGSVMATIFFAICMKYYIFPFYPLWQILVFALTIALGAHLGDLIFSVFKRGEEIKDYGRIIPGHGGILDRFDSLILAAPIFYYVTLLLK